MDDRWWIDRWQTGNQASREINRVSNKLLENNLLKFQFPKHTSAQWQLTDTTGFAAENYLCDPSKAKQLPNHSTLNPFVTPEEQKSFSGDNSWQKAKVILQLEATP